MKLGIVICDRYGSCGGGKCFRSVRERAGAFSIYPEDEPLEVVGFGNCGGCPGGNFYDRYFSPSSKRFKTGFCRC